MNYITQFLKGKANRRNIKIEIDKTDSGVVYSVTMAGYVNPYNRYKNIKKTFCIGHGVSYNRQMALEQAYRVAMKNLRRA